MPNTRTKIASKKAAKAALKKQVRNHSVRSALKTHIAKAEKLISAKEIEPAASAVTVAVRASDKAVNKGIIHKNKAARTKSRLARKLNRSKA